MSVRRSIPTSWVVVVMCHYLLYSDTNNPAGHGDIPRPAVHRKARGAAGRVIVRCYPERLSARPGVPQIMVQHRRQKQESQEGQIYYYSQTLTEQVNTKCIDIAV